MSVAHTYSMARESVAVHDGSMLVAPPRAVAKYARGLVKCPSVGVYSTRCFMLLASLAGRTTTAVVATGNVGSSAVEPFALEGTPLKWVKALAQEGHASACLRHGLDPTGALVFLPDEARGMVVFFPANSTVSTTDFFCSINNNSSITVVVVQQSTRTRTLLQYKIQHFCSIYSK